MKPMDAAPARCVTIGDFWNIFVRHVWTIVLVAPVAVALVFAAVQLAIPPLYASTATLYILHQDEEVGAASTASDFSLALNVVNDCTYLLKSHAVLDEVIDELQLTVDYEELYDRVSTANPDDTRILEVTVQAETPELAKEIVDVLCEIGQEKITDAMGFQQVHFFEKGTLDSEPSNRISAAYYLLIGMIASVLVYSAFLIAFLLRDRIDTAEDVQQYLGLDILGEIPNADRAARKANRFGRKRGDEAR
ncbi:MAG: Wzz/FepE/Etk N-terminal domain-containing protein [Clostridiales bacterium]|nr:Wzz/FepE/Etk N-terminal domain-containing protein [Clostridiales bacterium]